jgi:hypothetical protein
LATSPPCCSTLAPTRLRRCMPTSNTSSASCAFRQALRDRLAEVLDALARDDTDGEPGVDLLMKVIER